MKMKTTAALALVSLTVLAAGIRAQQIRDSSAPAAPPKTGTALIAGTVVTDEQTPQPVRRATVSVTTIDGSVARTTFTDEAGRFTLSGLPEGRYNLIANKPPFLRSSYGAKRYDLPGTPITLKDAGRMADITLRLMRGAVLSGRISDENGEPAFGVNVRALLLRTQAGDRTFVPSAAGTSFDTTDDHGVFRLFGLPPGEYAITASPRLASGEIRAMTESEIRGIMQALQQQQTAAQNAQAMAVTAPGQKPASPTPTPTPTPDPNRVTVAYATVFYPGTTVAASAGTVTVGPGDERTGIDFPLRLVRTTTVEGQVVVPAGIAPQSVQLLMIPNTGGPGGAGLASLDTMALPFQRVAVGPDGKFKYTAVAPGQYTISAQATKSAGGGPPPPPPPPPPPGMAGGGQMMTFTRVVTAGPGGGGGGEMPMDMMMIGGGDPNGAAYWAQVDLGVDGSPLSGVTLTLQPGMTITGKVEFRSANVRSGDFNRVGLTLMPAATGSGMRISTSFPTVQVDGQTGKFTISGVVPGRYSLRGQAPVAPGSPPGGAWRLGSAVFKGRDMLDFPLDVQPNEDISDALVVFTDATQSISGSLQDASGRPAPDYTIVVFSADKAYWTLQSRRVRTARPGTDGKFSVANLPAGDYRMAAVVDMAPSDINDPAFLEQLVGASYAIKLAVGEQKTQDLKISGGL